MILVGNQFVMSSNFSFILYNASPLPKAHSIMELITIFPVESLPWLSKPSEPNFPQGVRIHQDENPLIVILQFSTRLTSSVNVANKQGSCQRQTQNNNRKC
jgi:hypothetical protein